MAKTISRGVFAWMLWMVQKTKPRVGRNINLKIKLAIPWQRRRIDVTLVRVESRAGHVGRMSSRTVAFSEQETTKLNNHENTL